ncbi:MAG: hypothetical protein LAT63_04160 [Marinobacter sp.]|nr:hypothetical protein [Marinobacter sp.]
MTRLLNQLRHTLAEIFLQIAAIVGLIVGGTCWAYFGSLWAAIGGFLLTLIASGPLYGWLHGSDKPSSGDQ